MPPISIGHPAEAERLKHRLEDRLMSEDYQRIEVITGVARRRHWSTEADRRGEFRAGRDGVICCPAQRCGVQSSLPLAPSVERGRCGSSEFG